MEKKHYSLRNCFIIIILDIVLVGGIVSYILYNHFYPEHYRKGLKLAEKANLSGVNFYNIKEGYYCGEGGIDCDHGDGFIYYTDAMTEKEAMKNAGFDYLEEEAEYNNGADSARIRKITEYKDGFLIWYEITGEA